MTGRRSSIASLKEPDNSIAKNGLPNLHTTSRVPNLAVEDISKRGSDRRREASDLSSLPLSSDASDVGPPVTKPLAAKLPPITDITDTQASLRFHHIYHSSNTSRAPSTRTSSSSLQALNEHTVVDARSDHGLAGRTPITQRMSHRLGLSSDSRASRVDPEIASHDYPVYPDQSYAVLQSQVHPTYQPPFLRSRSSYPSHIHTRSWLPSRVSRTAGNTPVSSPGLFSVRTPPSTTPLGSDDETRIGSPYLHPTHLQPPKETHTAEVDRDLVTGNKLINQYEILEELGRGEHGKVKLGRHVVTKQQVAIKIVQRYSKRRRLGKLGNPEDKVKREVAILKKARHPNVVSLLEVIDDPNRQKVYIVLEYVENGEIVWRKRGLREIVHVDKIRIEREKNGLSDTPAFIEESQQYVRTAQHLRRQREKARERRQAHAATVQQFHIPAWSLEHGGESDDEQGPEISITRTPSRSLRNHDDTQHSPRQSLVSTSDTERRNPEAALAAVEGSMYGAYADYSFERRFSTASSSLGYAPSEPEWQADDDDMSYVPCLTIPEARNAFRDAVLGLEYLHYQGIIHRDIKPANLLMTSNHRVKISDFGVSYLGRPIRDDDEEQGVTETDAAELDDARELSKTVGTPAFYAPELCYTGDDFVNAIGSVPKITGAIDVWSLGVTLYGMIFGRLPFLSDDEYSMFQNIVKKDVFIPRKRLKPVEDNDQQPRGINSDTRMEHELEYEEIDDELFDLLKRILTKDPVKRITLKEIKHHPWVLHGLPNPRAWVEETDPGYQSKGKRIEVSSEEVTTAVSKVPFIQRVRSNVAKWSTYLTGRSKDKDKDKDHRKRNHSASPSADLHHSFGKNLWEGRRFSLRGDEDTSWRSKGTKEGEHPLAQSVTASPVEREGQTSYFASDSKYESYEQTPRPEHPQRTTSSFSTTESTKTVRPSESEMTPSMHAHATTPPLSGQVLGIPGLGRASSRLARGLQTGEWHTERPSSDEMKSLDGDRPSEPSIALSVTSAVGQMENPASHVGGSNPARPTYERKRSERLECESSAESFHLTKETLFPQAKNDIGSSADNGHVESRVESETSSNDFLNLRRVLPCRGTEYPVGSAHLETPGLTTSPPSAATISSSSADDYTSGLSQSTSHPSIPSILSGASSLSGDGFYTYYSRDREKESEPWTQVPSILRTGETVKARGFRQEDDESRYYCDDEEESDDEGIIMCRKKPAPRREQGSNT